MRISFLPYVPDLFFPERNNITLKGNEILLEKLGKILQRIGDSAKSGFSPIKREELGSTLILNSTK